MARRDKKKKSGFKDRVSGGSSTVTPVDVEPKKKTRKQRKQERADSRSFAAYPSLEAIKPRDRYIFHSDYFEVDGYYASVLTYRHNTAAVDNFGPFWGINRIPNGLPDGVVTINFEQVSRMSQSWVESHQHRAETVSTNSETEQAHSGTNTSREKARRSSIDLRDIAIQLNNGESYLNVHDRLLVKAPTLEALESAIRRIETFYTEHFGTLSAYPHDGDQRRELSTLFARNTNKRGRGEYFTSSEYAGSYMLVTHGLEDANGEFVGRMTGDVNNSGVIFDVDAYRSHVVIASEQINERRDRVNVSDMWGAKLGQACMLNGHRVVHIVLNDCRLSKLGPKFEKITSHIDMSNGDVNMFEMFGDQKDEMSIFPSQMRKLILMGEQAYESNDDERAIIQGSLEEIATEFYIHAGMWRENAKEHRNELRVVGIPHREVPRLQEFVPYLDTAYKALVNSEANDQDAVHAMSTLRFTFSNILTNNGDLFNTYTTDTIDSVRDGRRVIYDFAGIMERGRGVAMAQLINVIGFAVGNLGNKDLVVVHGAEEIVRDEEVRDYIDSQFEKLKKKGGRIAYCYSKMERALEDQNFSRFDKADYTVFGNMTKAVLSDYIARLGQEMPSDLESLITQKTDQVGFIHRGFDNVVFDQQLQLDIR